MSIINIENDNGGDKVNKKIIFITLSCLMVLILCGSASATDLNNTTNITQNNHVYINVSNDNGVKYNVDYDYYLNDPQQQGYNPNGTNVTTSRLKVEDLTSFTSVTVTVQAQCTVK